MERFTSPNTDFILIGYSFRIFYKLVNLTGQILIKNALGGGLYSIASLIFMLMFLKPVEPESQCHGVYSSAIASDIVQTHWCRWEPHWEERVARRRRELLSKGQMPLLALQANSRCIQA